MHKGNYWRVSAPDITFPPLDNDLVVDIAIIGGGITGMTAALLLAQAGKKVAVLEAHHIGLGTTGHSTGNLYATVDDYLFVLRKHWGDDRTKQVVAARLSAMALVAQTVQAYQLDCEYTQCNWHFFTQSGAKEETDKLQQEFDTMQAMGLAPHMATDIGLPFPVRQSLVLPGQAQFHPLRYVRGLAGQVSAQGGLIFEQTPALDIDEGQCLVQTPRGKVQAQQLIMATHTPKGRSVLHTELGPYRKYCVAARLNNDQYPPHGIYWSAESPHHSLRVAEAGGKKYLIVMGEKQKTGEPDSEAQHFEKLSGQTGAPHQNFNEYYERVEAYTRTHFDVAAIDYCWSAQHYRPDDHLPFIGRSYIDKNVYVATGFSTDGLTYGTLAAQIISDEILGKTNPYADLFSARRFTPGKSALRFATENADVATHYLKDYLKLARADTFKDIAPGEGRLANINGHHLAVYRDDQGTVTALSPICPHLKCIVHWNDAERTWDCPCHGSRFSCQGEVIEGPALAGLSRFDIGEEK